MGRDRERRPVFEERTDDLHPDRETVRSQAHRNHGGRQHARAGGPRPPEEIAVGMLDPVDVDGAFPLRRVVVVADRRAAKALPGLMAALPSERQILIPSGERQKRLRTVEKLLEAASAMGAERGDAWVGVGGGVTTDMVGAAAALYVRGVNFVAVTTTWLGMTDAAIGGKVAVDLSGAKNAAGAFWPPTAIVGDVATQRTLPRTRRLDGMAESLKSGIIGDPEDIGNLVAFLVSDRARYVNAANIRIDGGMADSTH